MISFTNAHNIQLFQDFIDNIGQRIPPVALQRIPVVSLKGYRS